jgi:hypothetical protein
MASLTRVNGDAQPVFAIDVQNGHIAPTTATAGTPVNMAGPKLDFFSLTANATMATQQGVIGSANGYVAAVLQAVQQTSTLAFYQVDGTRLSLGIYPAGAYANAATLLSAANVTYTGFQLDSAASVGFKLATS